MAGETMSTFADFLKVFYIPGIRVLFNKSSYFYFRMERDTKNIVGKNATVPLQRGLLPTGSRDENDTAGLPAPGDLPKDQAIIPLAQHYARIRFSGIIEAASKTNLGAFVSVVTNQTSAAADSLKRTANIQCVKSHEGLLATLTAQFNGGATGAVSAATMTVDTTQWMYPGMRIGVQDPNNAYAKMDTGLAIDTILSSTQIKVTGTVSTGIESGDKVYIYDNRNKQMYGMDNIFDTSGTDIYLDVDRSAVAEWQANLLENGGDDRNLDLNLMQQAVDLPEKNTMGKITAIHCRHEVRRAYVDHLVADRRYNYPDTLSLDGGFKGLAYTGGDEPIPVLAERDMTPKTMYFLDESTFYLFRLGQGLNWIPGPINGIFHSMLTSSTSTDGVMAGLRCYENIGCLNPRKSTILCDLNEM